MLTDRGDPESFSSPTTTPCRPTTTTFQYFGLRMSLHGSRVPSSSTTSPHASATCDLTTIVCRVALEFSKMYSFEEFLSYRTAVGSRNFGIIVDGVKLTAMVPYADMLNHFRPRETSWTFNNQGAFVITSLKKLVAGQQVMDPYGKKCNSKFLLHYGFAIECNREEDGKCQNEVLLTLRLPGAEVDGEELHARKLNFVGASRAQRSFRVSMNHDDRQTAEALSYVRICAANDDDLDDIFGKVSPRRNASNVSFINARNERAALELLAAHCEWRLKAYPKTMEENMRLRDSGAAPAFKQAHGTARRPRRTGDSLSFWMQAHSVLGCILLDCEDAPAEVLQARYKPENKFDCPRERSLSLLEIDSIPRKMNAASMPSLTAQHFRAEFCHLNFICSLHYFFKI